MWCPCGGWLRAGLAEPTAESWLRTEEDAPPRSKAGVSPIVVLCGAQDAKCYGGMGQESGCSPPVASRAGVSLSAERSPEMDSAFLVMGNDSVVWECSQPHVREPGSALRSAMKLSWRPREVLPVIHHFLLFVSDVGGLIYLVPRTCGAELVFGLE